MKNSLEISIGNIELTPFLVVLKLGEIDKTLGKASLKNLT